MATSHHFIETYFKALAKANNLKNLEAIEKLYHPEAEWYPPGGNILKGWPAFQAIYQDGFQRFDYDIGYSLHDITVAADQAFVTGETTGQITSKEYGDIVPMNDKYMAQLQKVGEQWLMKKLIWNQSPKTYQQTTEKKVTGVGGIFFKAENPDQLKEWYQKHLGLAVNKYGSVFEFREGAAPHNRGYLQWSPFSATTTYFEPSSKEFMINYRVKNMENLVKTLRENGVTVCDEIATYEYGKFVHILDLENNKIELWEPIDKAFTEIYEGKTTL